MFPAETAAERRSRLDDNRRAVEEAATLGTTVLVLVCGPPNRDLDAARGMVEAGIDILAPYAAGLGVKLGIEPFHPALMTERSVIVTLAKPLTLLKVSTPTRWAWSSTSTTSSGIRTFSLRSSGLRGASWGSTLTSG